MSLSLPSAATLAAPSRPASSSAARSNERGTSEPPNFGEVLSRSLKTAAEPAETVRSKPSAAAPARRQADERPTDPQELVNALSLALLAPEIKVLAAMPADTAAASSALASSANLAAGAATAATPGGAPTTPLTASQAAPLTELAAGTATAATAAQELTGADLATEAATARTALPTSTPAAVASTAAALPTAALPAAALPAALASTAGALPVAATAVLPAASAGALARGANTGSSDASSQREPNKGKAALPPDSNMTAGAGTGPASQPGRPAKVGAVPLAASAGTAASPATSITVPASAVVSTSADPIGAGSAITLMPLGAATPGASGAATPAAVTSALLPPEVGHSEWGKALSQQLVHMSKAGQQVAELQLNPPGLGPLKVTLSMNEQQVQAQFVSTHSSVRSAVEAALPQLRATLADSGINLGNTSVSAGNQQQQQSAFDQRQNDQPEQSSHRNERMPADSAGLAPRAAAEPARPNRGLTVDTYA